MSLGDWYERQAMEYEAMEDVRNAIHSSKVSLEDMKATVATIRAALNVNKYEAIIAAAIDELEED